ncbi:MAG: hypothetical protein PHN45_00165 [Methylococcales bacterium]|nr:hypothetical protein [Methylococcales bacterium]
MGNTESSDTVNAFVGSLLTICDSGTQNCWTKVTGGNAIVISGSSDVVMSDIKQGLIYTVDIDCTMSVTSNTCINESMDYQAQQHADAVKKGYGLSSTDADTYLNLCQTMVTQVSSNYTQNLSASANLYNEVLVENSSGVTVNGINQSNTYNAEITGMMSIDTVNAIATQMTTVIDQYTSAESSQTLGLMLIGIAVLILVVIMVIGMFGDLLFNPAFWFLCSSIGLILCGYFCIAYLPQWWPYTKIDDDDTDDSKEKKKQDNKDELYGWLIAFAIFAGIDIVFIILALMAQKQKKAKQQPKQTSQPTPSTTTAQPAQTELPTTTPEPITTVV